MRNMLRITSGRGCCSFPPGWSAGAMGLLFALLAANGYAGALYFPEMSSASESSYAGAGMVARANDAGTVFSNPAGMTRFDETEILAGGTGVFVSANYHTSANNTATGSSRGVNNRIVPAGSFAYVRPLSDRLKVGISIAQLLWSGHRLGRRLGGAVQFRQRRRGGATAATRGGLQGE